MSGGGRGLALSALPLSFVAACTPPGAVHSLPHSCPLVLCSELDWEIVVIDDNSPDGTQDVVRQLQQQFGDDRWGQAAAQARAAWQCWQRPHAARTLLACPLRQPCCCRVSAAGADLHCSERRHSA